MSADRIEFTINGTPKSWKAPQVNFKTRAVYKGKQERQWKESILGQALSYKPDTPWQGPVYVSLFFRFRIPQSWPKWRRALAALKGWMDTGPDDDNLGKAVVDALKGVFFEDDRQVAWRETFKQYARDDEPVGVEIVLKRLPGIPKKKLARVTKEMGG